MQNLNEFTGHTVVMDAERGEMYVPTLPTGERMYRVIDAKTGEVTHTWAVPAEYSGKDTPVAYFTRLAASAEAYRQMSKRSAGKSGRILITA